MIAHGLFAKVAATVVTGAVGAAAYDALRRVAANAPVHEAAVTATSGGCAVPEKQRRQRSPRGLPSPMSWRRHANASGKRSHRPRWPTQTTTTSANRHQQ